MAVKQQSANSFSIHCLPVSWQILKPTEKPITQSVCGKTWNWHYRGQFTGKRTRNSRLASYWGMAMAVVVKGKSRHCVWDTSLHDLDCSNDYNVVTGTNCERPGTVIDIAQCCIYWAGNNIQYVPTAIIPILVTWYNIKMQKL